MSKVNAIRKKALEFVRTQDWQSAIKEYRRLAELDQSNPNVFNELGDIHLKLGSKSEAYEGFSSAIDAYTRVGLYNNAVAVCKKVLRLIPTRYEVLVKLGYIRKKQGLGKEAESYYFSYFDKVLVDQEIGQSDVARVCANIVDEMGDSAPVLERVYDCQIKFKLKDRTGSTLQKLCKIYAEEGASEELEKTRKRMQDAGVDAAGVSVVTKKEGPVITEANIWSASHTDGERIELGETPSRPQQSAPLASSANKAKSVYEYGDLQLGGQEEVGGTAAATEAAEPQPADSVDETEGAEEPEEAEAESSVPDYDVTPEETTPPIPPAPGPHSAPGKARAAPGDFPAEKEPAQQKRAASRSEAKKTTDDPDEIRISAILGDGEMAKDGVLTEDDYRSHYDLGMAYLEMDLLAEAIREYQTASKCQKFQIRALEMIGLCFLKQNQPNLAIKQLTRGLQLIGSGDREALGIKYNLGLAYEMIGDFDNARSAFEDVYVEDVTFRDVTQKIEKYS